jgi:prepilin-type N-terminal cleavage/methylation domain-containing protein
MMRTKWGMWKAECGAFSAPRHCAHCAARLHSPFPIPHSAFPRTGLTLIELLITMTIIAIISAAILGTAAAAMENARRSRTRSAISKIHGLVMERWDSYSNRRVDVSPHLTRVINRYANAPGLSDAERRYRSTVRGAMLAEARLLATRELMKLELPNTWKDVNNDLLPATGEQRPPVFLAGTPGVSRMYYRRLMLAQESAGADGPEQFQSAECLYMLVMYHTGDGEARTMFTSQDIGDVDGDGAPEFLDGWGGPIRFIRWPAGFVEQSPLMTGDGDSDHDPFDTFDRDRIETPDEPLAPSIGEYSDLTAFAETPLERMTAGAFIAAVQRIRERNERAASTTSDRWPYLTAFRLVPLIFSHGEDEQGSIYNVAETADVSTGADLLDLDPYVADDTTGVQNGLPDPESDGWRDNIHNHVNEY